MTFVQQHLASWSEFKREVERLRRDGSQAGRSHPILYRGQARACWSLQSTLERVGVESHGLGAYIRRATRYVHYVNAETGSRWDFESNPSVLERRIRERSQSSHPHLPSYDYLVYLRQYGFPSPLLDWTESHLLAVFFALSSPECVGNRFAVDVLLRETRGLQVGAPFLSLQGPYTATHKRHFRQRSWYTLAVREGESEAAERFTLLPHQAVIDQGDKVDFGSPRVVRLTIPKSEAPEAVRALRDSNINHFTVFGGEESLVRTITLREFGALGWSERA